MFCKDCKFISCFKQCNHSNNIEYDAFGEWHYKDDLTGRNYNQRCLDGIQNNSKPSKLWKNFWATQQY